MRFAGFVSVFIAVSVLSVSSDAAQLTVSSEKERTSLEITVYNNGLGLVKETRGVILTEAEGELTFTGLSKRVVPESIWIKSLSRPDGFKVIEQSYRFDVISRRKLLDRHIGEEVKLVRINPKTGKQEVTKAELLSNRENIFNIDGELWLGKPDYIILPDTPGELVAKPSVTWSYSGGGEYHDMRLAYLTGGISWSADYIITLNDKENEAEIKGWASVDNRSGTDYKDAALKLVAGEVQTVSSNRSRSEFKLEKSKGFVSDLMDAAPEPNVSFGSSRLSEFHLYELDKKTTIRNNEKKQITLIEAKAVKIVKEFIVRGNEWRHYGPQESEDVKEQAAVFLKFKNSDANGLGVPLSGGIARIYKKDDKGGVQFIGEDWIQNSAKDEKVRLSTGNAFDVTAVRKQTDYKKVSKSWQEAEWVIRLSNQRKEEVTVFVDEPMPGRWKILKSSHKYKKKNAKTIRFAIKIPAGKKIKLTYRVKNRV